MKVLLIANGSKPRAIREMRRLSSVLGRSCDTRVTQSAGEAGRISEALAHQYDIILIVGGDGSIHEVTCGLMRAQKSGENKIAGILPWPMGSGNDFARYHNWKKDADDLRRRIDAGPRNCDIGQIHFANGKTDYFINAMSAGLGPQVAQRVNTMPVWINGNIKFGYAILRTFPFYKKENITVRASDWEWSGRAMAVVIANARYFGSGIGIAPDARTNDGLLDLTIIGNVTTLDYLKHLSTLKRAEKVHHPEVVYKQYRKIQIISSGNIETDGEYGDHADAVVEVIPNAIRVY